MSNTYEVKQVTDTIVGLLPTIERYKAKKLATIIVNHPGTYPDDSFTFEECAAFVVAKHTYRDIVKK